jgi:deoxyribodipyrimidine photo-lyase
MTTLLWFRNDLRLADNPALHHALNNPLTGGATELLGCYVLCDQYIAEHPINRRQLWFIYRHLQLLQRAFNRSGHAFKVVRVAQARDIPAAIGQLCASHRVQRLAFNAEYPLNEIRRDQAVARTLRQEGISVKRYHDRALVPPGMLQTQQGTPYKVYTPFARAWRAHIAGITLSAYRTHIKPERDTASSSQYATTADAKQLAAAFAELALEQTEAAMAPLWAVGEAAAHRQLDSFCQHRLAHYAQQRDYPALNGTAGVSAYLAIGVLSPKQCFLAARDASSDDHREGADCWIGELIWRDFYMHIAAAFPALSRHKPMQMATEEVPWRTDKQDFNRWCNGQTGIPIVDAAMRQLNQTGWMHNRLRMICAMFLTKNLRIDWRMGERYFMQQLMDADFCANNGGWQWSASTGTDAAPYFRIMNPCRQSERFDPQGDFICRYVPELAAIKGKSIHQPPANQTDYPAPMVDLKSSRAETIALFKALK